MIKILVTGAGGQLGSELERLSAAANGDWQWLFTDVADLDITDARQVASFFEREQPGFVVNCAAYTDVDRAEGDRAGAFRINSDGPANLAAAARAFDIPLIHISTDFVFDGSGSVPYMEDDQPNPLNVYGESKLAGERAVQGSGCRGAVIRTSWLYSPYGRNFVKSIMAAAGRNPELRVVDDQSGSPTAADGLAAAILEMIPRLLSAESGAGLFHYCDAGVADRASFAREILGQAGLDNKVIAVSSADYPMTARRPAYSALDCAKISEVFGIVPRSWQDALAENLARME